MRLAVVLFNLGGPDSTDAVEPFLRNLFSDPAIIAVPSLIRTVLARWIASRRAPVAREIYARLGGRSPILAETAAQAEALEAALTAAGWQAKCFIAMRYWHPFIGEAVGAVKAFEPEKVVLLPLYPQYSTTTTASSLAEWRREAARQKLAAPAHEICCYPFDEGFVEAVANLIQDALANAASAPCYRVLFSAHGLPKRTVDRGDPYQWQVEQTVQAVIGRIGRPDLDWRICYQSRVGPLEWIGPSTDSEIRRAGAEGRGVIVVPIAFVSEHSETLVELDVEYRELAAESKVPDYIRVPAVRTHPAFIAGLARLIDKALRSAHPVSCAPVRLCPGDRRCGQERRAAHA